MTVDQAKIQLSKKELLTYLSGVEWHDIEFKEAQRQVPKSAYETVSAFSNTKGGWIVFGIAERNRKYEIVGVDNIDQFYRDFSTTIRSQFKVNHDIAFEEKRFNIEEKQILAIYIPEAQRSSKPIFLNGDLRRTYIRIGGSGATNL